ncbi:MAG: protoporphyrinogen oxidase [Casimicrobiaceae bacterium]
MSNVSTACRAAAEVRADDRSLPMSAAREVLVIGAGLTGLATAYALTRRGVHVRVVEAGDRVGGVIGSCSRDGALYELGPNSALASTPLIDALLDRLAIRDRRIDASAAARQRFIVRNGVPVAMPRSPLTFLRTPAFSLRAKLRLLREPFIGPAPAAEDESIAAFVRRRLGAEFVDRALDPFVAGIYAGDPETISVRAAFPRLHALEQRSGSLLKGLLDARRTRDPGEAPTASRTSFSFDHGMQVLPQALAAALPDVMLATHAERITVERDGTYSVLLRHAGGTRSLRAHGVVCAVPAAVAATLLAAIDAAAPAVAALRQVRYAPVASVASLYRRADVTHALDGFGFLVPRIERRRILGTIFSSSMFAGRAPAGHVLLTTFTGGCRDPEMLSRNDADLGAIVAAELAALLGAHGRPVWQTITRWPEAIPQYSLGHLDRMQTVSAVEAQLPGLFLAANYRGGVAIGDCIASAEAVAERVDEHLDRTTCASG